MKLGFIAGGFKPFTRGHYFLVEQAAKKCDVVYLFVSTGDRVRKGQMPLLWNDMELVWRKYLVPAMPSNVQVEFVSNPTTGVFTKIEELQDPSNDFYIFGDAVDAPKTFNEKTLTKYFPELVEAGKIHVVAFDRASNVNISGTKMRQFLATGNQKEFVENLPKPVQKDGHEIFNILKPKKVNEMKKTLTKEKLAKLIEGVVKEQLEEQTLQRDAFEIVEELKTCLRRKDWSSCKALVRELGSRLEGIQ